ncbi:sigma-54-dependent Fis family transcriptional regulator [Shewanella algae]|uniref:sigma-54 interaction domain-containing protein n=1 Tax=Shewanella algae TaxID=38313 RepID=UPI001AAF71F4|nr:sigma-54 dependent transcriptional regulator [Shewanella algae]MBO2628107.1 sigma-54-dependent Fis family transcriptional regulator [Shewanella algae]
MSYQKKQLLVSWIGATDLKSSAEQLAGPIWATVSAKSFDAIELIYNYPDEEVEPYLAMLADQLDCIVTAHKAQIQSPIDYREIYLAADHFLSQRTLSDTELSILLSPGTPAMQVVWVLLGKTRYPCQFYQASREQGVQCVDIPVRLSAQFLPAIGQLSTSNLQGLIYDSFPISSAFNDILTRCDDIQQLILKAQILAEQEVPTLILGESGTGKELFARAIHHASSRKDKAFVAINCGAIPSELIDSVLFGHKRGAFTGAVADKAGVFEQANQGTLFLDEFAELDAAAQVRLLRVLNDGRFTRLGDTKEQRSDFRLIVATNKDLMAEVSKGHFREDLFYRVAIGILRLPPLRERGDDIAYLAEALMLQLTEVYPDLAGKNISDSAKKVITLHNWPGNIRELKATLLRAALWATSDTISARDIEQAILPTSDSNGSILNQNISQDFDIHVVLGDVERHYILAALSKTNGSKRKAAQLLGYNNHQTLSNRMKKLAITSAD